MCLENVCLPVSVSAYRLVYDTNFMAAIAQELMYKALWNLILNCILTLVGTD